MEAKVFDALNEALLCLRSRGRYRSIAENNLLITITRLIEEEFEEKGEENEHCKKASR